MTGPSSERTADADVATVRAFFGDCDCRVVGPVESAAYLRDYKHAEAALDRLAALVAQHRPSDGERTADEQLVRNIRADLAVHEHLHAGTSYGRVISDKIAALDRLVARNQQLQETLAKATDAANTYGTELHALRWMLGLETHEGEERPSIEESVRNLENLYAAALASVRARTPA